MNEDMTIIEDEVDENVELPEEDDDDYAGYSEEVSEDDDPYELTDEEIAELADEEDDDEVDETDDGSGEASTEDADGEETSEDTEESGEGTPSGEEEDKTGNDSPEGQNGEQTGSEGAQTGDGKAAEGEQTKDYSSMAASDVAELARLYPALGITDLKTIDNPGRYGALREMGLSVEEAFRATNYDRISAKGTGTVHAKQDGKAHIRGDLPDKSGGVSGYTMSASQLREARELFPGKSDKEILALYKSVSK